MQPLNTFRCGDHVKLKTREFIFRNIEVVRVSDSGVAIKGYHRDGPSYPWRAISESFVVSGETEAEPRTQEEDVAAPIPVEQESIPAKVVTNMIYPKVEFSLKELASLNNLSTIKAKERMLADGLAKFVRDEPVLKGGVAIGKPRKIYAVAGAGPRPVQEVRAKFGLLYPSGKFSTKEVAELNNVSYQTAFVKMKAEGRLEPAGELPTKPKKTKLFQVKKSS